MACLSVLHGNWYAPACYRLLDEMDYWPDQAKFSFFLYNLPSRCNVPLNLLSLLNEAQCLWFIVYNNLVMNLKHLPLVATYASL